MPVKKKTPEKTVRLNFLVRPEFRETIERLRERSGADSMTEVLRRAVLTYQCLESAHEVRLVGADGTQTVLALPEFTRRES